MIIRAYPQMAVEHSNFKKIIPETSLDYLLISISENEKYPVNLQYVEADFNCKGLLIQYFADMDRSYEESEQDCTRHNLILFNDYHAKTILEFIESNILYTENIIIHCAMGVSRSQGVAAAISKILIGKDDVYFKGTPNRFVYSLLLQYYFSNEYKFPNINEYYWNNRKIHNDNTDNELF